MRERQIMKNQGQQQKNKNKEPSNENSRFKQKKLVLTIYRLAPKIINFARIFAKSLNKKSAMQYLLFPDSKYQNKFISQDRNQNLINEYKKQQKNWYQFYFANNSVHINNWHLNLFTKKKPIPIDYGKLKMGRILTFGQFVAYSPRRAQSQRNSLSSNTINLVSDSNPKNNKSAYNGFIIPQTQTQQWQESSYRDYLFMGTSNGFIIATCPSQKTLAHINTQNKEGIQSLLIYKKYMISIMQNKITFYKLQQKLLEDSTKKLQIIQLFATKIASTKMIYRATFFKYLEFYFLFFINSEGVVKRLILKQRRLSPLLYEDVLCQPDMYNPFTNMKIFYQAHLNRVIIVSSCTKEILLFSYQFINNKISLLYKFPNPKNPPMNPRNHILSCIQFFEKSRERKHFSENISKRISKDSNFQRLANTEHQEQGQDSLLVAVSFTQRMYFLRISEESCQLSRRCKFFYRILKIQSWKQGGLIIVMEKKDQKIKQWQVQQNVSKEGNVKSTFLIISTLISQILSFRVAVQSQIIRKFDCEIQVAMDKMRRNNLFALLNYDLMILTETSIERISISSWYEVYQKMLTTQNIQLLYFLLLLKNYQSLYFTAPRTTQGLQGFFKPYDDETRQILLQYYYETNQSPPKEFMQSILHNHPHNLLPFILEHKISNLTEESKQYIVQLWKKKDMRIVEELIMAGCQYGWEIAISEGWMRSLRKIVELGMEVNFPLLKLSSFVVTQIKKLMELDEIGSNDLDYQKKANETIESINSYTLQMVEYILVTYDNFLQINDEEDVQQLRQFLLTILRPQVVENCFKYCPKESVLIISKIFETREKVELLSKFSIQDFLNYQKQFKKIIRSNYLSVSQCLLSFFSQKYREQTQKNAYTIDQQTKFRELLTVEHAKIMQEEVKTVKGTQKMAPKFQFTRPYLIDILHVLVAHNNEYLKQVTLKNKQLFQKTEDEIQCYAQDLLVKIWNDAKDSPISNQQTQPHQEIKVEEIKNVMSSLQQLNSSNNYLLINIMLDLPTEEYSLKIFRKFIYSQNSLIQQRLFDWLMPLMENTEDMQLRALLENELMNNLKSIIEINKQRSRELFDRFFKTKQKQIIKKIDNDPHLQLDYLEMIIQDATQNQIQLEEYYLNLYLKLLIIQSPLKVITVLEESLSKDKLNKIKYNFQQALKYSIQIENYPQKHEVQTYLYEKLGQVEKCIVSYLKILEYNFWEYINASESLEIVEQPNQEINNQSSLINEQYEYKQNNRATKKLSIISDMISQNMKSKNEARRFEFEESIAKNFQELITIIFRQEIKKLEYIKIPLDSMLSFSQKIIHQKLKYRSHYLSMISFHFGKIIIEIFEKNWLQFFHEWLREQKKIDFNSIKKQLYEGYSQMLSQYLLLSKISVIDKNILLQSISQMLLQFEKSVYCEGVCVICNGTFEFYNGEALLFNCGHMFHHNCIEQDENGQDNCWECIYKNQMQAMINNSDIRLIQILEKYCMKKSKNFRMEIKKIDKQPIIPQSKKIMNRLGIFDKKKTTLQNQIQILEMKLEIQEYYESLNKL